jgi:hypothetical protein
VITLTTPPQVNSVLGGNTLVSYNKLVLSPITLHPTSGEVGASFRLTSTTVPAMQAIVGTLRIVGTTLTVEVPQMDFYRQVTLTGPQRTSIDTIITNAQNAIEAGLISLGVIAGTQSTGS